MEEKENQGGRVITPDVGGSGLNNLLDFRNI